MSFFDFITNGGKLSVISEKLKPKSVIIEIILVAFTIIGVLLKVNNIPGANLVVTISMIFLSQLYYFLAFAGYEKSEKLNDKVYILIKNLLHWSKSICVIGILFVLTNWPGYELMITVGLITLIPSFFIILYFLLIEDKSEIFSVYELIRSFILISVIALLNFYNIATVL